MRESCSMIEGYPVSELWEIILFQDSGRESYVRTLGESPDLRFCKGILFQDFGKILSQVSGESHLRILLNSAAEYHRSIIYERTLP